MEEQNKVVRLESYCGLKEIHMHWGWFLSIGILLTILGVLAIGASTLVTLASMLYFGVLMIIGGVVQAVNAIKTRKGGGFLINALSAILYLIIGVILVLHPAESAITITLLLAAFFTVSGLFKMVAAISHRYAQWGWLLLNGLITLALGIMIFAEWPISGLWVIGLFIGIDLIVMGWTWTTLALASRNLEQQQK
jgi:uncharacterized membrane protein HdeD (DUF308 family)